MTTVSDPHLSMIRWPSPRTPDGCEECLWLGAEWVHLRLCLTIVRSFEPGEEWRWCHVYQRYA
jgi:hypothetical protein